MKQIGLFTGILAFLLILLIPPTNGLSYQAIKVAAVAVLMTVWWVTEAIPIAATGLVPIAIFPLLGILTAGETCENYGHNYVLMLLAGFILSKAIELHHLHKRIALTIMKTIGSSRRKIILSFMVATALLSMWIANVAVALMMLSIAMAIIQEEKETSSHQPHFAVALMLSIAYAASIGGTGTLIGTPPNMVFIGMFETLYPQAPKISFFQWMMVGVPLVIIFIPLIWMYLVWYFQLSGTFHGGNEIVDQELKAMGKMKPAEKRVLFIFMLTAFGWIFRRDFVFGDVYLPGWGTLLGVDEYVHDSTVAVFTCLLLFLLPAEGWTSKNRLLTWKAAEHIPWGVVMIVGGGYALAAGFAKTGLVEWLGQEMQFLADLPLFVVFLVVIGSMTFLTEINSNTATANIFLPVLGAMSVASGSNPLVLMIPATFACSFAFMLPSGTGTNAVIFGSEQVTIPQMARCGFWLNLMSVLLLTIILYLIAFPIFGITGDLPDWAK